MIAAIVSFINSLNISVSKSHGDPLHASYDVEISERNITASGLMFESSHLKSNINAFPIWCWSSTSKWKWAAILPVFQRDVTISSDRQRFKDRLHGSVQWGKNMCIFKPWDDCFSNVPVFSMVSVYADKWLKDYGKENGYFITHRSLIT